MESKVYFTDISSNHFRTIFDNLQNVLRAFGFQEYFQESEQVAVKLSFGEWGNLNYIRPQYIHTIVEMLKASGAVPFLTDTNTLYAGMRTNAPEHIRNAVRNGFGYEAVGAPVIIADGIKGNSYVQVDVEGEYVTKPKIASDIYYADGLVCVSHFKFHELAGFGGAIKNLGMGCAAKAGKIDMHSDTRPEINKRCKKCGKCLQACGPQAIRMEESQACIDKARCIGCGNCILVCNSHAIKVNWESKGEIFHKKLVEYAYGAAKNKAGKAVYVNFLTSIAPVCDCVNYTPAPLIRDIGIVLSEDPVACDLASIDICHKECLKAGLLQEEETEEGIIGKLYPDVPWRKQLEYAERMGMGSLSYQLVPVKGNMQQERRQMLSRIAHRM